MSVVSRNWDEIIKWDNVYNGKLVVVRIDSALSEDVETIRRLGKQIAFLRRAMNLKIIVVQGSRSKIDTALQENDLPVRKDQNTGMTELDAVSSTVADTALRELNGRIAEDFQKASKGSIKTISLAGYDKKAIELHPLKDSDHEIGSADLIVEKSVFGSMLDAQNELFVPIVYPFCAVPGPKTALHNMVSVDADAVALAIARDMNAHRLIICSNVLGVLGQEGALIPEIFTDEIPSMIAQSKVRFDMIARLTSAGKAVEEMSQGAVVIMDVRYPDSLLNELLSDQGGGTLIRRRPTRPAQRDFHFVRAAELQKRLTG
ncbi:MAG TPA: hypothetical protein DCY07_02430 [Rhodospirillaceae bacterium]|nr:hypothetical protein [Rhodospirillaceae bacterium]